MQNPPRFEAVESTHILPSSGTEHYGHSASFQTQDDTAQVSSRPILRETLSASRGHLPGGLSPPAVTTRWPSPAPAACTRGAATGTGSSGSRASAPRPSGRHRQEQARGARGGGHQQRARSVSTTGTVYACGSNQHGQLGLGDTQDRRRFKRSGRLLPENCRNRSGHTSAAVTKTASSGRGAGARVLGHGGEVMQWPRRGKSCRWTTRCRLSAQARCELYAARGRPKTCHAPISPWHYCAYAATWPRRPSRCRRTSVDPAGLGRWHAAVGRGTGSVQLAEPLKKRGVLDRVREHPGKALFASLLSALVVVLNVIRLVHIASILYISWYCAGSSVAAPFGFNKHPISLSHSLSYISWYLLFERQPRIYL